MNHNIVIIVFVIIWTVTIIHQQQQSNHNTNGVVSCFTILQPSSSYWYNNKIQRHGNNHHNNNKWLLIIPSSPNRIVTYSNKRRDDDDDDDDDEHDDDDDDNDDDDIDDEPPDVDITQFNYNLYNNNQMNNILSYGYNKGRSSPNQRKGMGISSNTNTNVYICSYCGSEYIRWYGKCLTCLNYNTIQQHNVQRQNDNNNEQQQQSISSFLNGGQTTSTSTTNNDNNQKRRRSIFIDEDDHDDETEIQEDNTESSSYIDEESLMIDDFQQRKLQSKMKNHQKKENDNEWIDEYDNDEDIIIRKSSKNVMRNNNNKDRMNHIIIDTTTKIPTNHKNNAMNRLLPIPIQDSLSFDVNHHNNKTNNETLLSNDNNNNRIMIIPNDNELNHILGGGIMKGSITLLTSTPTSDKDDANTFLFQLANNIASPNNATTIMNDDDNNNGLVWFITNEDDGNLYTKIISSQLGIVNTTKQQQQQNQTLLSLWYENSIYKICEHIIDFYYNSKEQVQNSTTIIPSLSLIVIDNIDTLLSNSKQINDGNDIISCLSILSRLAKLTGIPIMIGSTTITDVDLYHRETNDHGNESIESIVDCVLHLQNGGRQLLSYHYGNYYYHIQQNTNHLRFLHVLKNRYDTVTTTATTESSQHEVGIYKIDEMDGNGRRFIPITDNDITTSNQSRSAINLYSKDYNQQNDISKENTHNGVAIGMVMIGKRYIVFDIKALVIIRITNNNNNNNNMKNSTLLIDNIPTNNNNTTMYNTTTINYYDNETRLSILLGILYKHYQQYDLLNSITYIDQMIGYTKSYESQTNYDMSPSLSLHTDDLAICIAIISSLLSQPVQLNTIFIGEMNIVGQLNPISSYSFIETFINEVKEMGFTRVIGPIIIDNTNGNMKKETRYNTNNTNKRKLQHETKTNIKDDNESSSSTTTTTIIINGIEYIACSNLNDAINEGLVSNNPAVDIISSSISQRKNNDSLSSASFMETCTTLWNIIDSTADLLQNTTHEDHIKEEYL